MAADARVRVLVSGRVQGVGFRYYTQQAAQRLALVGWVRNLRDGRVEAVAEGERETLEQLLSAIRRGPPSSLVEDVQAEWSEAAGGMVDFRILMTV